MTSVIRGSSGSSGTLSQDTARAEILYSDSNWAYVQGAGTNDCYFRSRQNSDGQSGTGHLDFGYFKLKNTLSLSIAGGGDTNGNLKALALISLAGTVLATYQLSTLIGINSDGLRPVNISTSAYITTIVSLRFSDNDTGTGWAWLGVDLRSIFVY